MTEDAVRSEVSWTLCAMLVRCAVDTAAFVSMVRAARPCRRGSGLGPISGAAIWMAIRDAGA